MATLEAPQTLYDQPRLSALTMGRRPGYVIFDMAHLFPDQPDASPLDLSRRSAIELSSGTSATVLPRVRHGLDAKHDSLAADTEDLRLTDLPYTWMILSGLTRYLRSHNHASLADWTPSRIELDRYVSGSDILYEDLPQGYRRGREIGGHAVTAMVQLKGSRDFEIDDSLATPYILPGQVALFRAPGLIDDPASSIPDIRFSKVSASENNLTMTVLNRSAT
jgi:hypothetical protein